jgi:hypothetical protein
MIVQFKRCISLDNARAMRTICRNQRLRWQSVHEKKRFFTIYRAGGTRLGFRAGYGLVWSAVLDGLPNTTPIMTTLPCGVFETANSL